MGTINIYEYKKATVEDYLKVIEDNNIELTDRLRSFLYNGTIRGRVVDKFFEVTPTFNIILSDNLKRDIVKWWAYTPQPLDVISPY